MTRRLPYVLAVFAGVIGAPAFGQQTSPVRQAHVYDITPDAGQWAILVKSYSSEAQPRDEITGRAAPSRAFTLAFELVSELRRDYKLPAYFYNRGDVARREEEQRVEERTKQRHEMYRRMGAEIPATYHVKRQLHIEDQYAVLIAARYKDIDAARADLDRIRKLRQPSQHLLDKGFYTVVEKSGTRVDQGALNPFQTAFVVPNPTVPKTKAPEQEAEAKAEERAMREFNADEPYSLLDKCPGKWTLVVKAYRGTSVLVSKDSERSLLERAMNKRGGDMMSACAKSAHQLAEILRHKQLNFESYVLHTRSMSLVTVGSFDSERDPRMQKTLEALSKLRLDPEKLENPPKPFQVPK